MKTRPCGNPECGVSTGIHDMLTFGSGELDGHGFWEFPCATCARAHEAEHPDEPCWPHTDEDLIEMGFNPKDRDR